MKQLTTFRAIRFIFLGYSIPIIWFISKYGIDHRPTILVSIFYGIIFFIVPSIYMLCCSLATVKDGYILSYLKWSEKPYAVKNDKEKIIYIIDEERWNNLIKHASLVEDNMFEKQYILKLEKNISFLKY